jgi:glycerol-3-phosphate O-acyltransferase / dihydroxyacetone phosphate acyltransferase
MVFHLLKYWASWLINIPYKNARVHNLDVLRTPDPVIIAMNHPNAFTDPMIFQYLAYPLRLNYLARGDAFKPGFLAWALESLGLLPIFRMQDAGKEGLKKNDATYQRVNARLRRGAKVIVFAEGICIQERRLRPLKKGVARMVFGAYEDIRNDRLKVVPVGVNYSKPDKMRSNVFYNIGEPLFVKDFMDEYAAHPARAYNTFLETLEPKLRELVIHVDDPANDEASYMLEMLCKRSMMVSRGLNRRDLAIQFRITKDLTRLINETAASDPDLLLQFRDNAKRYFQTLRQYRLRDWLIDPAQNRNVRPGVAYARFVAAVILFPLFAIGYFIHLPALRVSQRAARKINRNIEFYSSFLIGISMFTFPLTYVGVFTVAVFVAPHVWWAVGACAAVVLCGIFSVWYRSFLLKTGGMLRILKMPEVRASLEKQRIAILGLVNKFYTAKAASPAH